MYNNILLALMALLGNDSFSIREAAQAAIEDLTVSTDHIGPVRIGLLHDDAEVRRRCRDILDNYQNVPIVDGLMMWHFDDKAYPEVWHIAFSRPYKEDVIMYISILMEQNGLTRAEIAELFRAAKAKRDLYSFGAEIGFAFRNGVNAVCDAAGWQRVFWDEEDPCLVN